MRERIVARGLRRVRKWSFAGALLPLLTGCAVVGYPARQPVSARPAPAASGDVGALPPDAIVQPTPAPAPAVEAASSAPGTREYVVRGERYTILASAENYSEIGIASWYGNELAGRATASGEPYDPQGMTAAHRSLPLYTWVEVTNLENGRKVRVRVNDRGPFARTHERIIDVSYAAARILGLVGPGTARVEVRAVPPPSGQGG